MTKEKRKKNGMKAFPCTFSNSLFTSLHFILEISQLNHWVASNPIKCWNTFQTPWGKPAFILSNISKRSIKCKGHKYPEQVGSHRKYESVCPPQYRPPKPCPYPDHLQCFFLVPLRSHPACCPTVLPHWNPGGRWVPCQFPLQPSFAAVRS